MMPNFAPAGSYAQQYGVKSLVYGDPGTGKTPLINTAPRPVFLAVEPGLLSMRGSTVPTCFATTPAQLDDFFSWLARSPETAQYDTVCVDSISQMAEIYLDSELGNHKDPRKAYGEMSRKVLTHLNAMYYMQNKHVYLICKQGSTEENNIKKKVPYFPGQDLGIKVPHLYDEILHAERISTPQGPVSVLRAKASFDVFARDRSGRLAEFEPFDLSNLFNKIMQG
jgi:AAA domain